MKKIICMLLLVGALSNKGTTQEYFGKTLNIGIGSGGYYGYYGYANHYLSVFNINYEFEAARNFTLAPSVSFYSYTNTYGWGNKNYPYRYYTYRQTVIPIGVKGTYYFDEILQAGSHWDFYLAGSFGFSIVRHYWDDGYYGDRNYYASPSPFFLDLHLGSEYHFNNKVGAFLDLSTGVTSLGIAIHSVTTKEKR